MAGILSRPLFALLWLLELLLVCVLAALLAAWVWSGAQGSLATLLREAPAWLPGGQTLEVQAVQGSIRSGGQIGLLRWRSGALTVTARDVRITWEPLELLRRRLQVKRLALAELVIDDQRPASPATPEPPPEVILPLDIDLVLALDRVRLSGANTFEASAFAAHYRYQDQSHQIQLTQVQVAQGQYQGSLRLQAHVPMALELQVKGQLRTPIGDHQTIALDAVASANGALAGVAPRLDLQALIQPGTGNTGLLASSRAMRANLSAQLSPWAAQPVVRAQASFNQLDLAALWPAAPRTLLTGNAWVRPAGANWLAELNLINRDDGPWDKGRLPVASARALVEYGAEGLRIESLSADAAGGHIRLQGKLADPTQVRATAGWQGQLQLQGINPARAYSTLEPIRLDGELTAAAGRDGVDFDLALQPSAQEKAPGPPLVFSQPLGGPGAARAGGDQQQRNSVLRGWQLQTASARGRWENGWLRIERLGIRTRDARLDGRIALQPSTRTASGQLALSAPGLQATVSGALAERDGDGTLALQLGDAEATRRWLARLPMLPQQIDTLAIRGSAAAELRWRGGWQALRGGPGDATTVEASVTIPQLTLGTQDQDLRQLIKLDAVQARLSGAISALTLSAKGNVSRDQLQLQIQVDASGGRSGPSLDWQGRLSRLQITAREATLPGPWTVALSQPVALIWTAPRPGVSGGPVLQIGAAQARLTGPAPGAAELAWQPITWHAGGQNASDRAPSPGFARPPEGVQENLGAARRFLVSKGELRGLPLAWLTLLADTRLESAGFSGDLLFDGQWDVTLADTLALRASMRRRSGDLRVQTDNPGGSGSPVAAGSVAAGIRVLQLEVQGVGDAVTARFRWDSERAGNAQVDLSTRLNRSSSGGWEWPPDSAIRGNVRAQMPQVGVWSLLAPPGWRVRGTVDASLDLSGTRRAPQWSGHLEAREMALRSVVDGIEFGNGQLRATLQGQRLLIERFSLQGAGGKSGGELTATGSAEWRPSSGEADASALAAVDLQIDAVAKALRVSARADRRLALSGTLQTTLRRSVLQIRGALRVDQALFILPDESAPSLGADVVVLGRDGADPRGGSGERSRGANGARAGTPIGKTGTASGTATGAGSGTATGMAGGSGTGAPTPVAARSSVNAQGALRGDLLVRLDLGSDFKVRGRGLDTRVAGELELRSTLRAGEAPTVHGELRTVGGQFKSYGQQLEIERGLLRFNGPYDNPSLDILAIRPKLTQRVGVQVTGNALLPRVRLYAEPDLPEAEKLAWLVLGRSAANGGAEAAVLQQAAMALLGGQDASDGIAGRLGLDELSIAGSAEGGGAAAATLTLGKRISQNFYVTYEHSLAGTLGAFSIFYDLSDRFTLRARTGERSAIDLIFKISYE